jgi:hypothetical protein
MEKIIATTETMTSSQPTRITDRFLVKARKAGADFPKDMVQTVLDNELNSLIDEMFEAFRRRVEAKLTLAQRGSISVTITEQHDPRSFFQTRPGLYISGDFRSRIVSKAKSTGVGVEFKLDHALLTLTKNMTDAEIETALPPSHLFDESAVCAIIAKMISEQPDGKEGKLLNNRYTSLFYTSCVVGVFWSAVYCEWSVHAWMRGECRWGGNQVFSPATAT